ncbi:MAG: hypothetical protein WCG75_02555 [Armatimonadota bacterium]
MIAIIAGSLLGTPKPSALDLIFSTTCDGATYYSSPSVGRSGETSLGPENQVQCMGYSGRGNPGGFFRLIATWSTTQPFDLTGSVSSEIWSMTLANNHIVSIDFSTDYRKTNPNRLPQLFLSQGSKQYIAEIPNPSTAVNKWLSASKSLSSTDFVQVKPDGKGSRDVNSHPDFTTTGASLNFMVGLDVFRTTTGAAGSEKLDYDNINITVHTIPNPSFGIWR